MQGGVKHGPCGRDIIASLTGRFPEQLLYLVLVQSFRGYLLCLFMGRLPTPSSSTQKLTAVFILLTALHHKV